MRLLVLLGDNRKYLTTKLFKNDEDLNIFIEMIEPLLMANVERIFPLRKRLELLNKVDYFPYAGAATDFTVIDLPDPPREKQCTCSER